MHKILLALALIIGTTSCAKLFDAHIEYEIVEPDHYPQLHAVGYAPISSQPGQTEDERVLLAMRASKLDAYRELAEQVHGQQLEGMQTLGNLMMQNSELNASVAGVIRGAKIVKSYPVGQDTYATEMSLDMQEVHQIYLSVAKPQRLKDVTYY
ncbi:flagellar biosynthesis protein FlgP [Alteromonas sediminis]|uniref:Flagellar biosynthesis protein FlgP n=1 Tax=Alteromonas sediminis TaxID=2259342 RepID=A0A3N5Z4I5_9ALTE|nr:LPP20 family lipoprotein [Alteromonas sediminis]RPJ64944.1 flagellar biosynthesis protein FlgP [Alteromonas sediminis]